MSNAHIKLAAYVVPEFPRVAAFIFLELLPAEETVALLQQRREIATTYCHEMAAIPSEMRKAHPAIEYP